MAKKEKSNVEIIQPKFEEDCCDFGADYHDHDDSMDLATLIQAHNFQISLAFELTKLIVENASSENKTEAAILNSFLRASKVVRENSPVKDILEE
ncbi:MAG: hypothetical protein NTU49_05785 [Gammaproteobacteria bacterium]|nr:hypothetical protein [Gammaproteobacteria bacterium]